jgi:hypothetical protein
VLLEREFHALGEPIVVGSRPQLSRAAL